MDSYTITIAPNDDSGAATRLVVDTSGDQVRITDVHLHAPQGLSSGHIPTVDFDLLLQAVTGTVTASRDQAAVDTTALPTAETSPSALEAAPQATEPPAAPVSSRRPRKATPRATATPATRPARAHTATAASDYETTTPRRTTRTATTSTARKPKQTPAKAGRKAARAKTAPAPAKKQAVARSATPAKTPTRKQHRAAATPAPAAQTGRVYRRTPDDLAAVLERVGTVAGVAAHYQVPRHTAQGWVSRLRATI